MAYKFFIEGKSIPYKIYLALLLKSFFSIIESIIRNVSGPSGFFIRRLYYKLIFKKMGKDVLIDTGVIFNGAHNISCGDRVWFDCYSVFSVQIGNLIIGNQVHIHTHTFLGGRETIKIDDMCAISSGSKIFSGSVTIPKKNDKILNPVTKANKNLMNYGKVWLKKNSVVLANCTISPGVTMGEGSMLLSNSFLNKSTKAFTIYIGVPAKFLAERI
jgi:galactoside O-acetyltransferase